MQQYLLDTNIVAYMEDKYSFGVKPTIQRLQQIFYNLGRGDWIRTSDHTVPNRVRYRTALRPDFPDY